MIMASLERQGFFRYDGCMGDYEKRYSRKKLLWSMENPLLSKDMEDFLLLMQGTELSFFGDDYRSYFLFFQVIKITVCYCSHLCRFVYLPLHQAKIMEK